jgi:rare lipoprotein A
MKRTKLTIRLILLSLISFFNWTFAQQRGNATFYHRKMQGHRTSDGSKYHADSLTCAHKTYPFGTLLKIRNPRNNKEVIVKVTDRGPHRKNLLIDLSYAAAKQLDIVRYGIAAVEIIVMDSTAAILPKNMLTLVQAR